MTLPSRHNVSNKLAHRAVLSGLLCACSSFAPAVTAEDLDAVIVESNTFEPEQQVGDVAHGEHTGTHTRLDRTELDRSTTIGDALSRGAGTAVRSFGAPGSHSSVTLRGSDSNQVAIYLDGMRLNSAAGGAVDLAELELNQVEGIDIYRGTTPTQLGHALPGGSINIRTPGIEAGSSRRYSIGYGSFNESLLSALESRGYDGWGILGSLAYRSADNDFPHVDDRGTRDTSDDRTVRRNNADYRQFSGLLKGEREVGDRSELSGLLRHMAKEQGLPARSNAEIETRLMTDTTQANLRYRNDSIADSYWASMLGLTLNHRAQEYDDREGNIGLSTPTHNRYLETAYAMEAYLEHIGEWRTSTLRMDLSFENYTATDLLAGSKDMTASRVQWETTLGERLHLLKDDLLLSATLRHRRTEDSTKGNVSPFGDKLTHDLEDEWTTGSLGTRYRITPKLAFQGNLATYVRTPSLYERFGDRGFTQGNPELKAETGFNLDVGVAWEHHWERRLFPAIHFETALFRNRVENKIVRIFDARGIGRSDNIAEAYIDGLEVTLKSSITRNLLFEGNLTYQESRNEGLIRAFRGKQLPGEPQYSAGSYTKWSRGDWTLFHRLDIETGRYYDSANLLAAEDRIRQDAGIQRRFGAWETRFTARNLTDDVHEDYRGHPLPGRSFFLSVRYTN